MVRGKKSAEDLPKRASFKWTGDMHQGMAEYLRTNYELYKKSLSSQRKMTFLRKMKEVLAIQCTELQFKNGFQAFLKKYEDVKKKLCASGFGVDPEKDATLNKHWIMKACPYFEILDEVMGTRPNVRPPYVVATGAALITTDQSESQDIAFGTSVYEPNSWDYANVESTSPDGMEIETEEKDADVNDDLPEGNTPSADVAISSPSQTMEQPTADVEAYTYIKKTFGGMNRKPEVSARNPLTVFAKIMGDKLEENSKVEREKMQMHAAQFESESEYQKERNRIELIKVDSQNDMEQKRYNLELEKLADRKADREHEIEILKLQQDFELKKLELQMKLRK